MTRTVWTAFAGLLLVIALAGCETPPTTRVASAKAETELTGMQVRQFATTDTRAVVRAVVRTLSDMGYIVDKVRPEEGLIEASKGTELYVTSKVSKPEASRTRVQMDAFVFHLNQWAFSQSDLQKLIQVDDPEFYQKYLFDPLSKALGVAATN